MPDWVEEVISLHSLGELILVVIATIGATQFAKVVARQTIGRKFDNLLVQTTALVIALFAARFTWTDHSGALVGGLVGYAIASLLASYGLKLLKHYKPDLADLIQGERRKNDPPNDRRSK
jgi:hypothetical protein